MEHFERTKIETERDIEHIKTVMDYLKHITTISTGAVVIVATFLDKVKSPNGRWLVAISMGGLVLSVLTCMIAYTVILTHSPLQIDPDKDIPKWVDRLGVGAMLLTWIGFFVGVLSLGIFGVLNLI